MATDLLMSVLPNGLPVRHLSRQDLQFLYEETFEHNTYLQHGVYLRPGDVVIDIGSNIGLFTLAAAQAVGPQGLVISVEPLPQLYKALEYNIQSHRQWCQNRGIQPAPVRLLQTGVGDGTIDHAVFTLYTEAAGWSSMRPDDAEVEANMKVFLRRSLASGEGIKPDWSFWAGRLLLWLAPGWVFDLVCSWYVRRMLSAAERVTCALTTVSDVISSHRIREVGLLKVDVERAELDVLRGVAARDWPRIRQVTMEAHDDSGGDGQLQQALDILRSEAGFGTCVVQQSSMLAGTSLYNVFCTRTL